MSDEYTPIGPVATQFHDMSSGGTTKTDYDQIFVELPRQKAIEWFEKTFGQNPHEVACTCCGPNFSITQDWDLAQVTAFERNCEFKKVEGESGMGYYIEEAKVLNPSGKVLPYTPFDQYIEKAAGLPGDNSENGALVVQQSVLDNKWQTAVETHE